MPVAGDLDLPRFSDWNAKRVTLVHQWLERLVTAPGLTLGAQDEWQTRASELRKWLQEAREALSPAQVLDLEAFDCWDESFRRKYREWLQQLFEERTGLRGRIREALELLERLENASAEENAADVLGRLKDLVRNIPREVTWPEPTEPPLPRVLVIDDELGRLDVARDPLSDQARRRLGELREAFCRQFRLKPAGSAAPPGYEPVAEADFCAGQGYDPAKGFVNDVDGACGAATSGRYALVLVDLIFNSGKPDGEGLGPQNDQVGLEILRRLASSVPPPVVALTAAADTSLIRNIRRLGVEYLHKSADDLTLLHHILKGRLATPAQLRKAFGLPDEFVAEDLVTFRVVWEALDYVRNGRGAPLLILGETGVGKNLLAEYIHSKAPWNSGPYVHVNCAQLRPELAASELFGYYGRAYTGAAAQDTQGYFQQAKGGTLVLDEFAELPDSEQSQLLKALDTVDANNPRLRAIQPVGPPGTSRRPERVEVTVLLCTNRESTHLRGDIWGRIRKIIIPPLRERRADILPLARFILSRRLELPDIHLDSEAAEWLETQNLPENVRTLEQLLESAVRGKGKVNLLLRADLESALAGISQRPAAAQRVAPFPGNAPSATEPIMADAPKYDLPRAVERILRLEAEGWGTLKVVEQQALEEALRGKGICVVAMLFQWALIHSKDASSLARYLTGRQNYKAREPQDVVKRWLGLDRAIVKSAAQVLGSVNNSVLKKLIQNAQLGRASRRSRAAGASGGADSVGTNTNSLDTTA